MLTEAVYSLGDPGSFDLNPGDPMYWTERFSYECSKNLYNLSIEGFLWRQSETSDATTAENDITAYVADFASWLDNAVSAQEGGTPVPAPPAIPALIDFLSGEYVPLLLKLGLSLLVKYLAKRFDSGTETGELADILKKGLIGTIGGTEYSFIELLQNTPLKIVISNKGEYEDIEYTSD